MKLERLPNVLGNELAQVVTRELVTAEYQHGLALSRKPDNQLGSLEWTVSEACTRANQLERSKMIK